MTENRLADYLEHMWQAATDACGFISDQNKKDFLADKRTQRAVIMSLIIIGEAATKTMDSYPAFTQAHRKYRGAACEACGIALLTAISISISMLYGKRCKQHCPHCLPSCIPCLKRAET